MHLPDELADLLEQGESIVKKYIENQGSFALFALTLQADGEVIPVLASEEIKDMKGALGGVLKVLIPWAKTGKITASCICTQVPARVADDQRDAVIFDLENRDRQRVYAVMPYHKHDYFGWRYGPMEFTRGKAQLFAP